MRNFATAAGIVFILLGALCGIAPFMLPWLSAFGFNLPVAVLMMQGGLNLLFLGILLKKAERLQTVSFRSREDLRLNQKDRPGSPGTVKAQAEPQPFPARPSVSAASAQAAPFTSMEARREQAPGAPMAQRPASAAAEISAPLSAGSEGKAKNPPSHPDTGETEKIAPTTTPERLPPEAPEEGQTVLPPKREESEIAEIPPKREPGEAVSLPEKREREDSLLAQREGAVKEEATEQGMSESSAPAKATAREEAASSPPEQRGEKQMVEQTPPSEIPQEEYLYVVREFSVRQRPARLLSDGTIEAELDEGWLRFENMAHLNEYLDALEELRRKGLV